MTWTPDTTPASRTFPLSASDEQFPLLQGEASVVPTPTGAEALKFYVDWNNNLMFDHAYSDISDYVQSVSWSRGRSGPSPQYDVAGTMQLNLLNNTAIFSSFNTASPIYGLILPNLRVKITSQIGSGSIEIVGLFKLDSIIPETGSCKNEGTATLAASGVISRFTKGKVNIALLNNAPTGNHVELILDNYGVHPSERIVDTGLSTISKWWFSKDSSYLEELHAIQDAECGRFRGDRKGNHVFDDRAHSYNPPNDVAQVIYGTSGLGLWDVQQFDPIENIYNYATGKVKVFNTSEDMILTIISDVVGNSGGTPPIVPGNGTLTVRFECPCPGSPSEVKSVDSWSIVDLEGNTNAAGTGTDITTDLSYVKTEYGQKLEVVITNVNALPAHLIMLRAHGVAIVEGDVTEIISQDTTSITKYGKREFPNINEWDTNLEDAQARLDYLIAINKDPKPRIQFTVKGVNELHLVEMQKRELGDRIHVNASLAATGLAIDADFIVDHIQHAKDINSLHTMQITCTFAPTIQLAKSGTAYTPKVIPTATKDFVLPGVPISLSVEASTYKFVVQWVDPATGNLTLFDSCVQFASDAAFTTDVTTRYGLGYVNNYTFSFPLKTRYFRVAMYNESGLASNATTKAAIVAAGGSADYGWGPFCAVSAAVTTAGLLTTDVAPNTLVPANMNISLRGWTLTCVFSALDADTVQWTSGTFTAADGTPYAISAGNTGNMAAVTHIYLDINISTTALQVTANAALSLGIGRVQVGVAINQTSRATFQIFGGVGGINLLVDNLVSNAASVNEFISNTAQIANLIVTNAKIAGLSVDKLTAGAITSKIIELVLDPGNGDAAIRLGKTDFGDDTHSGFILGADDSDSDKPKFEIGSSATKKLSYDGTDLALIGGTVTGGTLQTEATASRGFKITSTGFKGYDGAGAETLSYTALTGAIALTGSITAGVGSTIAATYLSGQIIDSQIAPGAVLGSSGDPAAPDFTAGTLTLDNNWHDLDLSAIVPAGRNFVLLRVFLSAVSTTTKSVFFRKNGNSNAVNVSSISAYAGQVAYADVIVPMDANRVIEYEGVASPYALEITIGGWFT